jgi:ferredoxin
MAFTITQSCISCDRCRTTCPTGAIKKIDGLFFINPSLCNDCVGYHGTPQCASVCPTTGACQKSVSTNADYWESWFNHYEQLVKKLKTQKHPQYWDGWFDTYSQKLQSLISLNSEQ